MIEQRITVNMRAAVSASQAGKMKQNGSVGRFLRNLAIVLGLLLLLNHRLAETNNDANRLYEDLMMSYNRFVRPVQNESDTLLVKLGLKLSQLVDVVSEI